MKTIWTATLLAAAIGFAGGCKKQNNDLSQVPPPPPQPAQETATFEPVQPEPVPAQPMMEPVPAQPDAGMADTSTAPGGTYTVEKGDTIYSIARKVYGNNARAKDIIAANPGIDPNKIKVGQVLNLPQ